MTKQKNCAKSKNDPRRLSKVCTQPFLLMNFLHTSKSSSFLFISDEETYRTYLFVLGSGLVLLVFYNVYSFLAKRYREHEEKAKTKKKLEKESKKKKSKKAKVEEEGETSGTSGSDSSDESLPQVHSDMDDEERKEMLKMLQGREKSKFILKLESQQQ